MKKTYAIGSLLKVDCLGVDESPPLGAHFLNQIHGDVIHTPGEETAPDAVHRAEGDGLMTTEFQKTLAVKVADCGGVVVASRSIETPFLAVVHAGWRGLAAGILPKALSLAVDTYGSDLALDVFIGPSIGPCCYDVGDDVASQAPPSLLKKKEGDPGKFWLDVPKWIRLQLNGYPVTRMMAVDQCTKCHPQHWYSARRGDAGQRNWIVATT